MAAFELKAEYEFRAVLAWHIVPEGTSQAMCGTPLAPAAQTRPISDLPHIAQACRACEVLSAPGHRSAASPEVAGHR